MFYLLPQELALYSRSLSSIDSGGLSPVDRILLRCLRRRMDIYMFNHSFESHSESCDAVAPLKAERMGEAKGAGGLVLGSLCLCCQDIDTCEIYIGGSCNFLEITK